MRYHRVHLIEHPRYDTWNDKKNMVAPAMCGKLLNANNHFHGTHWWYARTKIRQGELTKHGPLISDPLHFYQEESYKENKNTKTKRLLCSECMRAWRLLKTIHSLEVD